MLIILITLERFGGIFGLSLCVFVRIMVLDADHMVTVTADTSAAMAITEGGYSNIDIGIDSDY